MGNIWELLSIMVHCSWQAARHPGKCVEYCLSNPGLVSQSALPWQGSLVVLLIGIATWILSANWGIPALGEAARAMVYAPLGSLFGLSVGVKNTKVLPPKE